MKRLTVAVVAALLSACAPPPVLLSGDDPADPSAPVPPTRYEPVTAGTVEYRPAAPKPWVEQNRNVAPRAPGSAR